MIATDYFSDVIGQAAPKSKLNFYIEGYKSTNILPNFLITGPQGFGKTMLSRKLAKNLTKRGQKEPKRYIEVNCSVLKSLEHFWETVVVPFILDQEITVLFDEASELPRDITMAFLSILNPNKTNSNQFSYDGQIANFNFAQQSFIFATTELHKIFAPLQDRLTRIDMEDFKTSELAVIFKNNLNNITIKDSLCEEIATTVRGSPRKSVARAQDVQKFCGTYGNSTFGVSEWEKLVDIFKILPLGLEETELRIMRALEKKHLTLTSLSARLQLSRGSLMNGFEMYLLKTNLIEKIGHCRKLTPEGREYLLKLN